MIGIGDGSVAIDSAALSYQNQETGEIHEVQTEEILDDFVVFQMEFTDESQEGTYQLESFSYTAEEIY